MTTTDTGKTQPALTYEQLLEEYNRIPRRRCNLCGQEQPITALEPARFGSVQDGEQLRIYYGDRCRDHQACSHTVGARLLHRLHPSEIP